MTQPQTHPPAPQPPVAAPYPGTHGAFPTAPGHPGPQAPPRRRRTGPVLGVVAAGVAALGLAGGALLVLGTRTLDTAAVVERITAETEQQAGIAPTDVACPDDVPAEAGGRFACTGQLDGQPVTYTVRQRDDEGDVRFELDSDFVLLDQVELSVAEQVGADLGVQVEAACDADGHRVLVDGAGVPLPCTVTNASDPTDSAAVTATVDPDGTVRYEAS